MSRRAWLWTGVSTLVVAATAGWLLLDPVKAPSRKSSHRRTSAPVGSAGDELLAEMREIARLETREEGSGRERAQRLVPLLFPAEFPTKEFDIVHGPTPRWTDCTAILIGTGVTGCYWDSIGWIRLEARPEGARAVLLRAEGGLEERELVLDEGTLERGEFLAVTRALEVIAGARPTLREPSWLLGHYSRDTSGSIRIAGRSGIRYEDGYESQSNGPPGFLRCFAAARVAEVVVRSADLRRLTPSPLDKVWLQDAYRGMSRSRSDWWRDRYSGVLFQALGDSEGVELVRHREACMLEEPLPRIRR